MGISGLLPFVEKASKPCHVSEFRGCTVAVDSYCWLHKGAFGCAEKLLRGEDTDKYVQYCLKYIRMLSHFDIKVIMVFDGCHLPAKKLTEDKRRLQRKNAKKQAAELLRLGKVQEAGKFIRTSIDVTHQMALNLMKECRKNNIDCIVAPYEADAQLAFFNINKVADVVITEDSDLLLFGCSKVLFKLDLTGNGTLVDAEKLYMCMNVKPDQYSFDKFRYMCILSGCDYLESLPGIGIKKSLKFIMLTADPSIYNVLSKMPSYLNMKGLVVSTEYKDKFMMAAATFQHQLVYDPSKRELIPLTDPTASGTPDEYCQNIGQKLDDEIAFQLALGNLDPFSLKVVDRWSPNGNSNPSSIWCKIKRNILDKCKDIPTKAPKQLGLKLGRKNQEVYKTQVPVSSDVLENEALNKYHEEQENQVEQELMQYYNVEQVAKRTKIEDAPVEAKPRTSSPVLTPFNPFRKNKLSKFRRTNVDYNTAMRSRFFACNTTHESVSAETSNTSIENSEESFTSTIQESVQNLQIESNSFEVVVEKNMNSENESCKLEDESENQETLVSNNDEVVCKLLEMEATNSLKENNCEAINIADAVQDVVTKQKLVTRRRLGMSSSKKVTTMKQQTLFSMFNKNK